MVQLEEMDDGEPPEAQRQAAAAAPAGSAKDDPPDIEVIPGAELSAEVVPNLWLASEMALEELGLLSDNGVTHLLAFGALSVVTPEALGQGLTRVPAPLRASSRYLYTVTRVTVAAAATCASSSAAAVTHAFPEHLRASSRS